MIRFSNQFNQCLCALLLALLIAGSTSAQLRVVSYNAAIANTSLDIYTARAGMDVVLEAIGDESVGGLARPIDVLLLQEQHSMSLSGQSIVDVLNGIYGVGTYARSFINGNKSNPNNSGGAPGLVYNTQTIELIEEIQFGPVGTGEFEQPRATLRYQLRPVGYDSSADFYAYNSHYKSDTGTENNNRRLAEAQSIRANSDALGNGIHAIYAGDYNIQTSSGTMYQHLLSNGNGQAFDPINTPGSWNGNASLKIVHTQSPANTGSLGLTGGGVDDRFDFQLTTGEFLDGEGLSYLPGSYHAFGNNGTHTCCNSNIDTGTGASPAVLAALMTASDHLPVVADYQLPANMFASLEAVPSLVGLGESVGIDALIQNVANVLNANWADELDYTLSVSGSLIGGVSGTLMALAPANIHEIFLNTSTLGTFGGTVTVSTASQGAANSLYEFPVSFSVVDFLEADFNRDGDVDAEDLIEWQAAYGVNADGDADFDGDSDGRDFLIWQRQFGQTSLPLEGGSLAAVPEPSGMILVIASTALCLVSRRSFLLG
jgi:hypothetical protein